MIIDAASLLLSGIDGRGFLTPIRAPMHFCKLVTSLSALAEWSRQAGEKHRVRTMSCCYRVYLT
jgi:hypothetical protein